MAVPGYRVHEGERGLLVGAKPGVDVVQELPGVRHELLDAGPGDIQTCREGPQAQPAGHLRPEWLDCRRVLQERLHLAPDLNGLVTVGDVVVEDLPALLDADVLDVHGHLLLAQPRVGILLQQGLRVLVDAVTGRQDHAGALADGGHDMGHAARPVTSQLLVVADGAEGVVYPEELSWLVRVPPVHQLAGGPGLDRQATPVVRRGNRQHQGDDRLADRWLPEEQHEPVRAYRLGCLPVGLGDHERGDLVAGGRHEYRRLRVSALVKDLREVPKAVDPGHEQAQLPAARDRVAQPLVTQDQRVRDPGPAQPVPDLCLSPACHARIGHQHVAAA